MHLQVQIYTWPDATLRELTDLVKEVQPAARRTTARLEFALIYPDKKGRNVLRVVGGAHSTRPGPDDIKTLKQLNFQVRCLLALPCRLSMHVLESQSRPLQGYTRELLFTRESQDKYQFCTGGHGCCSEPSSLSCMHTHCCALRVTSACDAAVYFSQEGPPQSLSAGCCRLGISWMWQYFRWSHGQL